MTKSDDIKVADNESEKRKVSKSKNTPRGPDKSSNKKLKFKLKSTEGSNQKKQGKQRASSSRITLKGSDENKGPKTMPSTPATDLAKTKTKSKSKSKKSRSKRRNKVKFKNHQETHKLIIRNLPPLLSENGFFKQVFQQSPGFKSLILSYYFVNGEYPSNPYLPLVHSRCYISCIDEQSLMNVGKMIKLTKFKDDLIEGQKTDEQEEDLRKAYSPSVEKAIHSIMPPVSGTVSSEFNDTIQDDSFYRHFTDFCQRSGLFAISQNNSNDKASSRLENSKDIFSYINHVVNRSQKAKKVKAKKNANNENTTAPSVTDQRSNKAKSNNTTESKAKKKPKKKPKKKSKEGEGNNIKDTPKK